MNTPLYDELVVKYYLSKGIKPFSYPHEPVGVNAVPKVEVKIGVRQYEPIDPAGMIRYDLLADDKVVGTVDPERLAQSRNGYFNL